MTGDMALLGLALATPIGFATAFFDLKTMEIPNWLTGGAALIFLAYVFFALPMDEAIWRLVGGLLVLAICFVLFVVKVMGGGDAKAAAAFAPVVAAVDAPFVLLLLSVTALLGMVAVLLLRRTVFANAEADGGWAVWSARGRFPYGVALGSTLIIYLALVAFMVSGAYG